MSELEQYLRKIGQKLQQSEREQRLLEDDDGLPYQFTEEDAIRALDDRGASGDLPDNDVARVMRRR